MFDIVVIFICVVKLKIILELKEIWYNCLEMWNNNKEVIISWNER